MALVTKENAKVGLKIYACWDDRPLDGFGCSKGVITKVYEDHYLYTDFDIDLNNVWGEFDTDLKTSSTAVFTTEKEAKEWLNIK